MVGAEGKKIFDFDNPTLDRWKRHFREKSYIENYFYLLKSTKSTKLLLKNVAPIPHKRYQNTSGFAAINTPLDSVKHFFCDGLIGILEMCHALRQLWY